MPINIIDNFSVNVSKPIDARMVVANLAARNAISYKYDGLKVFQQDDRKTYTWNSISSSWSVENDSLADGYVPKFMSGGFTNSAIYSTSSNVGVNTNIPREAFQINNPIYPIGSEPLTVNMQFSEPVIAYNWYYSGSDQVFTSTKGSTKLAFGNTDFAFHLRTPSDPSGTFVIPLYMNIGGNVAIGSNSLTTINASSALFASQVPKLEITTGNSTGAYSEFMTLRHSTIDISAATRSLGYLMKLSSEANTTESAKMGGMMLESTQGASNAPSLYFLTNDQKRMSIDANGDIKTQANKYLHIPGTLRVGDDAYPVYTESAAETNSSSVPPLSAYGDNPVLKSISIPSYSTVRIEVTFTGRLVFGYFTNNIVNTCNKVVALFTCNGSGVITPVGSVSTIFAENDNAFMDGDIQYGSIDYSTANTLNLLGGQYGLSNGSPFLNLNYTFYEMTDYDIRILY